MTKQERLNHFLLDLADFLGKHYTGGLSGVSQETVDGAAWVTLTGPAESVLHPWSHNSDEVAFGPGECIWQTRQERRRLLSQAIMGNCSPLYRRDYYR